MTSREDFVIVIQLGEDGANGRISLLEDSFLIEPMERVTVSMDNALIDLIQLLQKAEAEWADQ